MKKFIIAACALIGVGAFAPLASPASAQGVSIQVGRDHDRGYHRGHHHNRGWHKGRGHHYGWDRRRGRGPVVVIKRDRNHRDYRGSWR